VNRPHRARLHPIDREAADEPDPARTPSGPDEPPDRSGRPAPPCDGRRQSRAARQAKPDVEYVVLSRSPWITARGENRTANTYGRGDDRPRPAKLSRPRSPAGAIHPHASRSDLDQVPGPGHHFPRLVNGPASSRPGPGWSPLPLPDGVAEPFSTSPAAIWPSTAGMALGRLMGLLDRGWPPQGPVNHRWGSPPPCAAWRARSPRRPIA
jgi:hypothetical protein